MDKSKSLMRTIFGVDNGFMRAAERVLDITVLNVLFVLTSLPLVTVGVGRIALYRTLADLHHQGRVPVFSTYWYYLKSNWRQGLLLGIMELAVLLIALFDLVLVQGREGVLVTLMTVIAYAVIFLSLAVHLYTYPLAGRYNLSLKEIYLKAFLLAGLNSQWTVVFLIGLGLVFLALTSSVATLLMGLSALLIFGFAAMTYGYVIIMEKLFNKYQE